MNDAALPAILLSLPLLASGCDRSCGSFVHQTGVEWDLHGDDDPPDQLDDYVLYEICGAKMGSFGDEDLLDDGVAWLLLDGTHRDSHVSQITSGIMHDVYFPTAQLQVGAVVDLLADLTSAYVVDLGGGASSGARLTEGSVEILDVEEEIDPIYATRAWRIRWDLTFGEPDVSEFWYQTEGEDWINLYVDDSP